MDKNAFGKRFNRLLKEKHVSSIELAKECDVTPVFIRQIMSALRLPSLPLFLKICNKLNISPNYLLADSLELDEADQLYSISKMLSRLTPKQLDMVKAMIEIMINKQEE